MSEAVSTTSHPLDRIDRVRVNDAAHRVDSRSAGRVLRARAGDRDATIV